GGVLGRKRPNKKPKMRISFDIHNKLNRTRTQTNSRLDLREPYRHNSGGSSTRIPRRLLESTQNAKTGNELKHRTCGCNVEQLIDSFWLHRGTARRCDGFVAAAASAAAALLRDVAQELLVAEERFHGLRRQAHLQLHATPALPPWERRHLPVELVRPAAPNRRREAPPEVVSLVHGEPVGAAHRQSRPVRVPQWEAPRRRLPHRHAASDRLVSMRRHVAVQQPRRPAEVPPHHLLHRRCRRDALDRVPEVVGRHLGLHPVPAVHRHPERRHRFRQQLLPSPRHGPPHVGAQDLLLFVRYHRLRVVDLLAVYLGVGFTDGCDLFEAVVGPRFELENGLPAEAEDPLSKRCVHRKRHLRAASAGEPKHRLGVAEVVSAKVRRRGGAAAAELRPRVEEVPERGPIDDGVVDGRAEEHGAVRELGELERGERAEMAVEADGAVEGEERLDRRRHIGGGGEQVGEGERVGGGVGEFDASVIAGDEDATVG
ncbi:unnamed protein product, partial [Musa textilis]